MNFIYSGLAQKYLYKTTSFKVIRLKYHIKGSNELRKNMHFKRKSSREFANLNEKY